MKKENMENKNIQVLAVCATVLVAVGILVSSGIKVRNTSVNTTSNGGVTNTVSVSGQGKVMVKPDMVTISLSFSEVAPTSKEALDRVNERIAKAVKVLKDNGVGDEEVTTSNLSVYPAYEWDGVLLKSRLKGQRATQSLTVKVKKIDEKATKAAKIIDELAVIDNVQLSGIDFDVEDKTKLYTEARELAFKKAKQKAEELAKFGGVRLGAPVSITDTTAEVMPMYRSNIQTMSAEKAVGGGADLPSGQMEVEAGVSVLWEIK